MATRKTPPESPKPANLTPVQMRAAIPRLERRIEELKAVDFASIRQRGEARFDALQQKLDDTLIAIFGADSIEYYRYHISSLDTAGINIYGTPFDKVVEGYRRGIEQAVSNLRTIIDLFTEKLGDLGETPEGRAARTFGDLDLHPEIARACSKLFHDGHYANAVEDACKVLDSLVKMRSGRGDLSGTDLMLTVFSQKAPILKFNELQTETHKSEQMGMMYLYAGAMLALRNPRAHELVEDHPERALEYLGLLSLLAKSLDQASK